MKIFDKIQERAHLKRRKIGIGLIKVDNDILEGLEKSKEYADIVIIGSKIDRFESISTDDPEIKLVSLLKDGIIEGAVRGNLRNYGLFLKKLLERFNIGKIYRLSLIQDVVGREFFFGPTGLNEGLGREDKILYIEKAIESIKKIGVEPKIGLLSPIRPDMKGENKEADILFEDAEYIAGYFLKKGYQAKHFEMSLDEAIPNCNFVVAANGMIGNQTSRALWTIGGGGKLLSLHGLIDKFVLEYTDRNEKDFSCHIISATALINWKESNIL